MANTVNINSAASTNAQFLTGVKRTSVALKALQCFNSGAGPAYVKLYDLARVPVVGTDIPVAVYAMPAAGNAYGYASDAPITFLKGLAVAITGGAADTDATAVTAGQVKVSIAWT